MSDRLPGVNSTIVLKNALDSLAYWMHANSKAIYNCTYAPEDLKAPENDKLTYNPHTKTTLYPSLRLPSAGWQAPPKPGYAGKVRYAQLLNDTIRRSREDRAGRKFRRPHSLRLPIQKPRYEIPVVRIGPGAVGKSMKVLSPAAVPKRRVYYSRRRFCGWWRSFRCCCPPFHTMQGLLTGK